MDDKKALQLVRTLLQKTRDGQLSWDSTVMEDVYVAPFPNASITVARDANDGEVFVRLTGSLDKTIDLYEARALHRALMNPEGGPLAGLGAPSLQELLGLFEDLMVEARRSAMGADNVLDQLLGDLQGRGSKR